MLGRRKAQHSLFSAQGWPHRVPEDSFYGRLGAVCDDLFRDEDLEGMYSPDTGRPSWPPSLMSGILLLQYFEEVSDEEAIARLCFDLRWKVALQLPLDFVPPHPSSLSVFRTRLAENGQERYAFDRLVEVGRVAGFLPENLTVLVDTTPQRGAGAVQDTYTLIRKGIQRVLKAAGYQASKRRRRLAPNLATYLEHGGKAKIDWADPKARASQLQVLVRDAEAALALAKSCQDDPELGSAIWVLRKILGDDVSRDEKGTPELRQGVATDRIVSVTDPEMRHGHKSKAQHFEGRKLQVAEEATSELLVAVEPLAANVGDGKEFPQFLQQIEERHDLSLGRVIADGAYGTGDNRAECAARQIELLSPMSRGRDPEVDKSAFGIDLKANVVTCPAGRTTRYFSRARDDQGRPIKRFCFDRADCQTCLLFARCVHSSSYGRTITIYYHEALFQDARRKQKTDDFEKAYAVRAEVERKIAELMRHGLRHARYIGTPKTGLQGYWTGAAVNLRRLFKLFKDDIPRMRQVLVTVT